MIRNNSFTVFYAMRVGMRRCSSPRVTVALNASPTVVRAEARRRLGIMTWSSPAIDRGGR